jgi:hypothetical protein
MPVATGAAVAERFAPEAECPNMKRGLRKVDPDSLEAAEDGSLRSDKPPSRRGRFQGRAAGHGSSAPKEPLRKTTET